MKNCTLRLLKAIVTLIPSSRKTRSSGGGRKSRIIFILPSGSFVYLILALIYEADRQHSAFDSTEAVVPLLAGAM